MPDITADFGEWVRLKQRQAEARDAPPGDADAADGLRRRKGAEQPLFEPTADGSSTLTQTSTPTLFARAALRDEFAALSADARQVATILATLQRLLMASQHAYLGLGRGRRGVAGTRTFAFGAATPSAGNAKTITVAPGVPFTDAQRGELDLFVGVMLKVGASGIERLRIATDQFAAAAQAVRREMVQQEGLRARAALKQLLGLVRGGDAAEGGPPALADQLARQAAAVQIHLQSVQWWLEQTLVRISHAHGDLKERWVAKSMPALAAHAADAPPALAPVMGGSLADRGPRPLSAAPDSGSLGSLGSLAGTATQQEQLLLEQEGAAMLSQLEDNLDQVRATTNVIHEIASLHTQMAQHLSVQAATIDALYAEAFQTSDTMRAANRSLLSAQRHFSGSRRWMLIFFLVMTFMLLVVDWVTR